MRSSTWVALLLALLAALTAAALAVSRSGDGSVANVYQDGVCICSIDLSRVTEPYSFSVTDGDGHENLIQVEPGRIRVAEANCPDQVCVKTGWLSGGKTPIVCLPARLVIRLVEEDAADDVDAVLR